MKLPGPPILDLFRPEFEPMTLYIELVSKYIADRLLG
jgi:hypothetical protein